MDISYTLLDDDLTETIATKAGYNSEGINIIVDFTIDKELDEYEHEFGVEPTSSLYVDPSSLQISIEPISRLQTSSEIKPSVPFDVKLLSMAELNKVVEECQEYVDDSGFLQSGD